MLPPGHRPEGGQERTAKLRPKDGRNSQLGSENPPKSVDVSIFLTYKLVRKIDMGFFRWLLSKPKFYANRGMSISA